MLLPIGPTTLVIMDGQALDIIDQDQSGDLGEDEVKTLLAAMGVSVMP